MSKRTAIYGGSFNPIHTGHTHLGEWLCKHGWADELWFLVSPQNPLKQGQNLLADEARLRLAQLAVEESGTLHVCDFEMHLPRPSYMVNTLATLRETYPDREFILVIGADNWLCFDKWYQWQEILTHHTVLVYPRTGYEIDAARLPSNVHLVQAPLFNISSTEIREAIMQGGYHGRGLTPKVWAEIRRCKYYQEEGQ